MGINLWSGFESLGDNMNNNAPMGVSLNLQKSDILDLIKRNPGLTAVKLAAG